MRYHFFNIVHYMKKKVTIKDIAEHLRVSISTVSRALANDPLIRKETRNKVFVAADELGYSRNPHAAALRNGHTNTIGIVASEMITPFVGCTLRGIQQVMNENGVNVILCNSVANPDTERENIRKLESALVAGIIIFPCDSSLNNDLFLELEKKGFPFVFIAAHPSEIETSRIVSNYYDKAYFLMDYLICSGRKKIIYISGSDNIHQNREIHKAYKDVLAKFKIDYDPEYVIRECVSIEKATEAIDSLIESNMQFDAIFASHDLLAITAMNRLRERGIRVPEDVGVAGFYGTPLSNLVYPPLTTVELPLFEMGVKAAELLLDRIKNPSDPNKKIVVDSTIRLRASTHK